MRLSEKTIELNITAQINEHLKRRVIWFGLTQAQEAIAGFDAAIKLKARVFLFQFKASNLTLKKGQRRFTIEHTQLQNLIRRVHGRHRSVFYVFPLIGSTSELRLLKGDFYNNSWVLDVGSLPSYFPSPTSKTPSYKSRISKLHYADVLPPNITIHSDPIQAKLESLKSTEKEDLNKSHGIMDFLDPFKSYYLRNGNLSKLKGFKVMLLME